MTGPHVPRGPRKAGRPPKGKRPFRPGPGRSPRGKRAPEAVSPARVSAYEALVAVERGSKISDSLLKSASSRGMDPKDVALSREIVYGVTRMRRLLDHRIATLCDRPLQKLSVPVRTSLRMGFHQLLHLDSIPPHAAVHESVSLVKRAGEPKSAGFVNALLRSLVERRPLPAPEGPTPLATMALRHSHPDWLVERWAARFGASAVESLLSADNRPHSLFMRAKPGARDAVMEAMRREGFTVEPLSWPPDTFVLSGRGSGVFESESFLRGDWIVQDWTPQAMLELAPVEPGMRVWDVCAAPGGKTVGLSWRTGPGGTVLASDVSAERLTLLRDNVKRVGAGGIRVHEGDIRKMPGSEKFQFVWVDAPCTGTGVLSRRADLRWRITPEDAARLSAEQKKLLDTVARRVYPGGTLLYSTCSLEEEENGGVVSDFLAEHPSFRPRRLEPPPGSPEVREDALGLWFLPTPAHDGGFLAALRRDA